MSNYPKYILSVFLLFLSPFVLLASTPHEELTGVKREIRAKQNLLKKTQKVEAAVSVELQSILKTLEIKESELKQLDRDLLTVESVIERTEIEIKKTAEEAKGKQRQIETRLISLYKAGELGAIRMFFSAETFPQMAENIRLMRSVLDSDKRIFAEYSKKIEELHQLKSRMEQDAVRKERLKGHISAKRKEIEEEKKKKSVYLAKVRLDRKGYEASLKELQANAARLQNMLKRLELESRRRAVKRDNKTGSTTKLPAELPPVPDRGFASQKGRMQRPVKGEIVEGFGKHKHPEFNSFTFTKGIFISAPAGSDIKAIYEGTVIFADFFKGYGNMVIVDHGGGYFSLYAHTSKILKKTGSEVNKGDLIATVGDSDSTRGPVLYFEIRHQGKPVDPAGWIR